MTLPLIPHLIAQQAQKGRDHGRFQAASLFVDISGFTALTAELMRHKKDGAEILTTALNAIFGPLVRQVYGGGGMVVSFAGDAFTAVFPCGRNPQQAVHHMLQTASFIQQFVQMQGQINTPYGVFRLGAHTGLGIGQVEWEIIGTPERRTFFFHGTAVESCTTAAQYAQTGEIVAAASLAPWLAGVVHAEPWSAALRLSGLPSAAVLYPTWRPRLRESVLQSFVPENVLPIRSEDAEFREVAPLFIGLDKSCSPAAFTEAVRAILDTVYRYGGYFNKLDFNEKGIVALVLFGAPVAHENDLARAVDCLLSMSAQLDAVGACWKAGLSFGMVYAGLMGGPERCEYTAIGDVVNMAARLMQAAAWGEVWVDDTAVPGLQRAYHLEALGEKSFKGKYTPHMVYRLAGHVGGESEGALYHGQMIGRGAEQEQLEQFLHPLFQQRAAGLMQVYGEAGMGKSRLLHETRNQMMQTVGATGLLWLVCPADEVLRRPLHPFKQMLCRYFQQSGDLPEEEKKARFQTQLDALIRATEPQAPALAQELTRTRPFLGAWLDLYWPGSLYDQVNATLRRENMLMALKTLFCAESLRRPLVLQIEDLHWLDESSLEWLESFLPELAEQPHYPIAILTTSRYLDDGRRLPWPANTALAGASLDLNTLTLGGVRAFGEQQLGAPLTRPLATLLHEKTGGNPFFVEQLLLDLHEQHLLAQDADGCWQLSGQEIEVPVSINAVLVARLDRLQTQVKQVVQTAAVLGQAFEVAVLGKMLQNSGLVMEKVKRAEAEMIWSAMSEMRYLFRHVLLRDAAYGMQLRTRLRQLHELAAQAIELLYAADLAPHYADLAHHYAQAHNAAMECKYALLTGEQAFQKGDYREMMRYMQRAHQLAAQPETQPVLSPAMLASSYLMLGRVYERMGDFLLAIEALNTSMTIARRESLSAVLSQALTELGRITLRTAADLEAARQFGEEAQAIVRQLPSGREQQWIESLALRQLSLIPMYQADYALAKTYNEESLAICRAINAQEDAAACLNNLGEIARYAGEYTLAASYYEQALDISRMIGMRVMIPIAQVNLGLVATAEGHLMPALQQYMEGIQNALQIGMLPVALWATGGLAQLCVKFHLSALAAELEAMTLFHPACDTDARLILQPVQMALPGLLNAEALAAAQARGRQKTLDTLVAETFSQLIAA